MDICVREPKTKAEACVIWMHGLGADAENMQQVVNALPEALPIRHVFMNAPVRPVALNNHMPMRAWYNILGIKLTDREDKEGILNSEQLINDVVLSQIAEGFSSTNIFLAGFSQGGAMALFTGLRSKVELGGILALSGYLPLSSLCANPLFLNLPIFMAIGKFDQIVLPDWTRLSYNWLIAENFTAIDWREYPMEHSICMQEIKDISDWLKNILRKKNDNG